MGFNPVSRLIGHERNDTPWDQIVAQRERDLRSREDLSDEELKNVDNQKYWENFYGGHWERNKARAAQMRQGMQARQREKNVNEFQQSIPKYQEQAFGAVQRDERRRLAEEMAGIKRSMNRRGLLYSGLTQDQMGRAQAGSAAGLAQARQDINKSFQSQFEQMRDNAIGTGLGIQENLQAAADMAYRQAVGSMMQRRGAMSAIGGAIGMGAGMYMGGPAGAAIGSQAGQAVF